VSINYVDKSQHANHYTTLTCNITLYVGQVEDFVVSLPLCMKC